MSSVSQPNERDDELEAAVDQAIAACDGDLRADRREQFSGIRGCGVEEGRIARLRAGPLSDLHRIELRAW